MTGSQGRLAGIELYFERLEQARRFYSETLGFELQEHQATHHAKFGLTGGFLCLEQKGVEPYPSADKAVVFVEVTDLSSRLTRIGAAPVVGADTRAAPSWAAVRDPEGHTVLLVQAPTLGSAATSAGAG
jgi:catechol 2,3-dioxygenase-like lactoylglutathione lyase family enzyme